MQRIVQFYRLLNILSLDVAIGAMISASFLAHLLKVELLLRGLLCLGLTVWLIYTADHLLDARKTKASASTERHRFHQRHFKIIFLCALLVLGVVIAMLFFLRPSVLFWGSGLALLVVFYFFVQIKLGFLKELFGAVLYSCGVLLPAVALSNSGIPEYSEIPIAIFVFTALINLILFSWFDQEHDRNDNHPSLVSSLGDSTTRIFLYFLFLLQFTLSTYCVLLYPALLPVIAVLILMNVVLILIFFKAEWFAKHDRYRLAGDAIFLLPIIYVLMK